MPLCLRWVMEAARKAITPERYARKTQRALKNFMKKVPMKRPTAKAPWAPARNFAPEALDWPGQVSTV